jgi:hypothetical protein
MILRLGLNTLSLRAKFQELWPPLNHHHHLVEYIIYPKTTKFREHIQSLPDVHF